MTGDESSAGGYHASASSDPRNLLVRGPRGPMLAHNCDGSDDYPKPGSAEYCLKCRGGPGDE